MTQMHVRSRRLDALPPFIFAALDEKRRAKVAQGHDVINVSIGDPDQPTPRFIIDAMLAAVPKPENHPYAYGGGTGLFREAAAFFMKDRFGVTVDPRRHVLACIGSKEGIGHLPLAVADPGDVWCIPEIHYPVYTSAAAFAGLRPHYMPMTAATGWAPVFEDIPRDVASQARLLITNHPNNPTASCVDVDYYERQVRFCAAHDIIAVSDQAYSEIFFDDADRPASLWSAPSADIERTAALEFHSLSKTFNMTGWRIGF
ncbi:MAG: aminotransferase class I/II-fold pyridoxal phosphate-dependent enzyme, partial [Phycisphaerales bacterium]|nr:aminotransferase class I/II-fold pyridoxal phosphate-dependent enzyme [Phycisphaerales bacterium]